MSSEKEKDEMAGRSTMRGHSADLQDDKSAFEAEMLKLAEENGVSEKTIQRHFTALIYLGIERLKSARKGSHVHRAIAKSILDKSIILLRNNPNRSVNAIIKTLEREGLVETRSVKRSALQDQSASKKKAPDVLYFDNGPRSKCHDIQFTRFYFSKF
ncbi:MAG: hypothetical protein LBJ64_04335 [Deltaproteobacteria bacterium]|jgi:DNA-binding transcriptional regulator YhcF (GntR family)|nr:hypothetical protein [Deltaproteobacteria bacterium]